MFCSRGAVVVLLQRDLEPVAAQEGENKKKRREAFFWTNMVICGKSHPAVLISLELYTKNLIYSFKKVLLDFYDFNFDYVFTLPAVRNP